MFYKYRTDQGNTITAQSVVSFTGLTVNEAQVSSTVVVPPIQPLYLYKVSGGIVVANDDSTINSYFINVIGYPINSYVNSTGGTISGSIAVTGSITEGGTALLTKYASKSVFNTYTGTTAPNSFQSHSSIVTYTGTTAPNSFQSHSSVVTLTGTTLPATYALKINLNTYTGTTAPATYHTKAAFNSFTGTTAPATYALKSLFNTYTGTTAPATYHTKAAFNSFSGTTLPANYQSRSSINTLTGTTLPATYVFKAPFTTYTGTTAPATYALKSLFNTYTGTTAPATYALKSLFNTFTGTTAPATYLKITSFNTYSGVTATRLGTVESLYVTGATNGLTKVGKKFILGGSLTGATTITSPATGSRLSFAGFPVQYSTDVSANYNTRSLVDFGYLTGNTNGTITFQSKGTSLNTPPVEFNNVNFTSGVTAINKGSNKLEVQVIYGSEVFNTGRTTTATNATTTFADYLAHGFTVAGGTYKIEYVIKMSNSATGNLGSQLLIDGASLESGTVTGMYNTSSKGFSIYSFGIKVLTAGAHSFRLQFNTSNGTVTADYGQILIIRIS